MQLRRRRRVLQEHLLIREHILGSREGRQSALVETGQNQLLLARVSVAVADRKDTGNVGFKTGGIDHDLLAIKLKTPFSDRAHLRLQAEEDEEAVERNTAHNAVVTGHTDFRHHTVFLFETRHRAHDKLHLPVFAELLHLGHTGGSSAEAIAAMDQNDALRLADEIQRPVESGVTAAADHDVLASEEFRITHPIEELLVLELLNARNTHRTGIKRAHTGGDDHGLAVEAGAQIGFHMEGTVLLLLNLRDDFAQVIDRLEGMILLQQVFSQLSRRVHRNSRNIVNRLLGVELHALAAHIPKRIHHVAFHLQKTEFENLKQPDRTSTTTTTSVSMISSVRSATVK